MLYHTHSRHHYSDYFQATRACYLWYLLIKIVQILPKRKVDILKIQPRPGVSLAKQAPCVMQTNQLK